jgi:hypothetical protein
VFRKNILHPHENGYADATFGANQHEQDLCELKRVPISLHVSRPKFVSTFLIFPLAWIFFANFILHLITLTLISCKEKAL